MDHRAYEDRVLAQIGQYSETADMHELPPSFHEWSHNYLRPAIIDVFDVDSIDGIYISSFIEAMQGGSEGGRILSIGCGYGDMEVRIAKALVERGWTDVIIDCADLSPVLIERVAANARDFGVERNINPIVADLNEIDLPHHYNMIMANHSLHHILGLERVFEFSYDHLDERGLFTTCDMIGRNGHMRWPETAAFVKALWRILDDKKKFHVQLNRFSATFIDHDCSTVGFEGIRAQDILPLILKKFKPFRFVASGGLTDTFFDRGYGHGFNAESDRELIHMICDLNEILLDADLIKPTLMLASFSKSNRGEVYYRDRRAAKCIRETTLDPKWTSFYT